MTARNRGAWLGVGVLLILALLSSACQPAPTAPPAPTEQPAATQAPVAQPTAAQPTTAPTQAARTVTIGLSWNEKGQPLVVAWEDYMKMFTKQLGSENGIDFKWIVNVADSDPMRQSANIGDLISQKVDIIVARPQDGAAIGSSIMAAQQAGIPFVTFDRESQSTHPNAHVGADSLTIAHQTGTAFGALLKQKNVTGKCIELEGDLRDQNAVLFHQGFEQARTETGAWTTLVVVPTEWNPDKFRSGVVDGFQAHPDANCLIVGSDFAFGAVQGGLEQAGKWYPTGDPKHIWIASIGALSPAVVPLEKGYIDVAGMWDAYYHSQKAAEVILALAKGQLMDNQKFLVAGRIATPANIDTLDHVFSKEYK